MLFYVLIMVSILFHLMKSARSSYCYLCFMEEERTSKPIKVNPESIILKVRGDTWFEALGIKRSHAQGSMHAESYTIEFM